mgnify:CR=1 FL=1
MSALSRPLKALMSLKRHMKALIGLVQAINKGLKRLTKALRGLVLHAREVRLLVLRDRALRNSACEGRKAYVLHPRVVQNLPFCTPDRSAKPPVLRASDFGSLSRFVYEGFNKDPP